MVIIGPWLSKRTSGANKGKGGPGIRNFVFQSYDSAFGC